MNNNNHNNIFSSTWFFYVKKTQVNTAIKFQFRIDTDWKKLRLYQFGFSPFPPVTIITLQKALLML